MMKAILVFVMVLGCASGGTDPTGAAGSSAGGAAGDAASDAGGMSGGADSGAAGSAPASICNDFPPCPPGAIGGSAPTAGDTVPSPTCPGRVCGLCSYDGAIPVYGCRAGGIYCGAPGAGGTLTDCGCTKAIISTNNGNTSVFHVDCSTTP